MRAVMRALAHQAVRDAGVATREYGDRTVASHEAGCHQRRE